LAATAAAMNLLLVCTSVRTLVWMHYCPARFAGQSASQPASQPDPGR